MINYVNPRCDILLKSDRTHLVEATQLHTARFRPPLFTRECTSQIPTSSIDHFPFLFLADLNSPRSLLYQRIFIPLPKRVFSPDSLQDVNIDSSY